MDAQLSPVQARVLAFCWHHLQAEDRLPTRTEISLHFGWSSANAAHEQVQRLVGMGQLERSTAGHLRFPRGGLAPDLLEDRALELEIVAAGLRLEACVARAEEGGGPISELAAVTVAQRAMTALIRDRRAERPLQQALDKGVPA